MKLIIQIPAHNEQDFIEQTLRDLPRSLPGITRVETLLIDDGSSDATVERARAAGVNHVVRLLSHRGLATAFTSGIDECLRLGADIIVNTDADNQYRGEDIARLVGPIVAGAADVVVGDRDMRGNQYMSAGKRFLQRSGSWTVSLASGVELPDVTSGFRAFSREAAARINVFNPFTYTLETIIQAGNRNLKVVAVPVGSNPPARPSRLHKGNLHYLRKSVVTIFRIHTLYKPLKTFFAIGAVLLAGGVILGLRFLWLWWFRESAGHVQSLILAAILSIIGFQTMLIGLLADLISVNRRLSEEVLLRLRRSDAQGDRGPRQRRRDEKPRLSRDEAIPEPAAGGPSARPLEPQWVWLVDETKLGADEDFVEQPGESTGAVSTASRRRRRHRKQRDERPTREPLPHHAREPHDTDD